MPYFQNILDQELLNNNHHIGRAVGFVWYNQYLKNKIYYMNWHYGNQTVLASGVDYQYTFSNSAN